MSSELVGIGGDATTSLLENRKREEPDVLSRQQINQSMMDIEDLHPLQKIAKKHHILPCLKTCRKTNDAPF